MAKREKMDDFTKMKLVFSGELLIFAAVFIVIGTLKLTGVIPIKDNYRQYIFPIVTLIGCTWFIVDIIWALCSKKHREKSSLLDKSLVIPSSLLVVAFDIYILIKGPLNVSLDFFKYFTGSLFIYFGLVYIFLGVYHYYKPIKYLVAEYEKLKAEQEKEALELLNENNAEPAETANAEASNPEDKPAENAADANPENEQNQEK